jgi:hypothetical protein
MRVAFVPRSAEIKPLFWRFVHNKTSSFIYCGARTFSGDLTKLIFYTLAPGLFYSMTLCQIFFFFFAYIYVEFFRKHFHFSYLYIYYVHVYK